MAKHSLCGHTNKCKSAHFVTGKSRGRKCEVRSEQIGKVAIIGSWQGEARTKRTGFGNYYQRFG